MLQTLQLVELADFSAVTKVANFATLVSTYTEGITHTHIYQFVVTFVIRFQSYHRTF